MESFAKGGPTQHMVHGVGERDSHESSLRMPRRQIAVSRIYQPRNHFLRFIPSRTLEHLFRLRKRLLPRLPG